VGLSATWVTWWGILAWEQALVFTTSFGAILCLFLDFWFRAKESAAGRASYAARSPPLLATFIRLAVSPTLAPPKHWRFFERFTLTALRSVVLFPLGPLCLTLSMGSVVSLMRFVQRCSDVRAVEHERATHTQWFVRVLNACNAINGLSSFGLFVRLYCDVRDRKHK